VLDGRKAARSLNRDRSADVPAGAARRNYRRPERRGAGKGGPDVGAAKRTLAGEHRSGIERDLTGDLV